MSKHTGHAPHHPATALSTLIHTIHCTCSFCWYPKASHLNRCPEPLLSQQTKKPFDRGGCHFFPFWFWQCLWIVRNLCESMERVIMMRISREVRDNNKGKCAPALGSNERKFALANAAIRCSHSHNFPQALWSPWKTHTLASTILTTISPVVEHVAPWDLLAIDTHCLVYYTVVVDCWFHAFCAHPHRRSSVVAMVVLSQLRCSLRLFVVNLHVVSCWTLSVN